MKTKALTGAIIKTASTFIVLVALIVGYLSYSFGWFAKNDNVKGGGLGISAQDASVEITKITSEGGVVKTNQLAVDFNDIIPGDSVTVVITVTCYKELPSLQIDISAPSGCETPVVDNGLYYYLGSQILITEFTYNGTALNVDAVGKSLMASSPEDGWGTTQTLTPVDITLHSLSPLTVGEHVFSLKFTFYNAPYEQNILKDFGKTPGQICYREFRII